MPETIIVGNLKFMAEVTAENEKEDERIFHKNIFH
jgi:hypothetical protein